jgi:hypothetical protein
LKVTGLGLVVANGEKGGTTIPLCPGIGPAAGNLVAGWIINLGRIRHNTAATAGFRPSLKGTGMGLAAANGEKGGTTIPLCLSIRPGAGNLVAGRMTNLGRIPPNTAVWVGFRPSLKGAGLGLAAANGKQGGTTILLCPSIGLVAGNLVAGRIINLGRILHNTAVMTCFRPSLKAAGLGLPVANG